MTIDREFMAQCGSCNNRWYVRLRGDVQATEMVRCTRCGREGVALELPAVGGERERSRE